MFIHVHYCVFMRLPDIRSMVTLRRDATEGKIQVEGESLLMGKSAVQLVS